MKSYIAEKRRKEKEQCDKIHPALTIQNPTLQALVNGNASKD